MIRINLFTSISNEYLVKTREQGYKEWRGQSMSEIISGFFQAINLIVTLNPDVMQIAALSLFISLAATVIAAIISIPLGGLIHFHEFRGKRVLIVLIQTLYSVPTVVVGLILYLLLSRSGPLGIFGLLFTPEGMILGQTVLIIPIMTGLVISALGGSRPEYQRYAHLAGCNRVPDDRPDCQGSASGDPQRSGSRFWSCDLRSRGCHDDRGQYHGMRHAY